MFHNSCNQIFPADGLRWRSRENRPLLPVFRFGEATWGRFQPILKQKSKLEDKGGGRVGGERGNLPPIKRLNCAPVKLYPARFNRLQSVRPLLKSDLRWQPADLDSFSAQSLNPEKKSGNEDKDRSGGQFWTKGSSGRLPDNLKLGRPAQFSPLTHQNSAHSPARS